MKVFLSHSSLDKKEYVRDVYARLKQNSVVYDEATFEAGMLAIEEIFKGIDRSSLFVVFLSDSSLSSGWVQQELAYANDKLTISELERIYPVIIDENICYTDARIPDWLRNQYNLRLIARPAIASRKIQQRLREVSWSKHPFLKKRKKMFVGRNSIRANA